MGTTLPCHDVVTNAGQPPRGLLSSYIIPAIYWTDTMDILIYSAFWRIKGCSNKIECYFLRRKGDFKYPLVENMIVCDITVWVSWGCLIFFTSLNLSFGENGNPANWRSRSVIVCFTCAQNIVFLQKKITFVLMFSTHINSGLVCAYSEIMLFSSTRWTQNYYKSVHCEHESSLNTH